MKCRSGLLVAALLGAVIAAPAQAATVGEDGETLVFRGGSGEANNLTIASVPGNRNAVSFADGGASIVPGSTCTAQADGSVTCVGAPLAEVAVELGDGDDRLNAAGFADPTPQDFDDVRLIAEGGEGNDSITGADAGSCLEGGPGDDALSSGAVRAQIGICLISGGEGNDVLTGNDLDDFLFGGPGEDRIEAAGGADLVGGQAGADTLLLGEGRDRASGGPGDDEVLGEGGPDKLNDREGNDLTDGGTGNDLLRADFRAGEGSDELRGGAGVDKLAYLCEGCRVSLNGADDDGQPPGDNVREIENVTVSSSRYDVTAEAPAIYGDGDDVIIGDRNANVLEGERGRDLIAGAGGEDRLIGGHGADRMLAADGERDEVNCGSQKDRAVVDRIDRVRGCERVRREDSGRRSTSRSSRP